VRVKAHEVRVNGRVQGVFYRASARREALRLGLTGWVMNLSDGSVGMWIQGDPDALAQMLAWCKVGPPGAEIGWLDVQDAVPDPRQSGFMVR
jgi:acylphosphatase